MWFYPYVQNKIDTIQHPFMIKNFLQTRNKTDLYESLRVTQKYYSKYKYNGEIIKAFPKEWGTKYRCQLLVNNVTFTQYFITGPKQSIN